MEEERLARQHRLARRIAKLPAAAHAVATYRAEKARAAGRRKAADQAAMDEARRLYDLEGPRLSAILVGRGVDHDPADRPVVPVADRPRGPHAAQPERADAPAARRKTA